MSVPKYMDFLKPLLQLMGDKKEHQVRDMYSDLAMHFSLSEADMAEEYPSGNGIIYKDRISWAYTYLLKAGLIERVRRSVYFITPQGLEVLAENPEPLDTKYLLRFPAFKEFHTRQAKQVESESKPECRADNSLSQE